MAALQLADLPGAAFELVFDGLADVDRLAVASCSRELRLLVRRHGTQPWRSAQLAVDAWKVPQLAGWLAGGPWALGELSLTVLAFQRGTPAAQDVFSSALHAVATGGYGGQLSSLSLRLHGHSEAQDRADHPLPASILQLLPRLQHLALHTSMLLRAASIDASLLPLTSLQLTCNIETCRLVLPSTLRHLALPHDDSGRLGRWLGPMVGAQPRSLHIDSGPPTPDDLPSEELDEDDPHPPGLGLSLATAARHLPQLQALSVNLENADGYGAVAIMALEWDMPTGLQALAVIRLPVIEADVLAGLPTLTRLWFSCGHTHFSRLPAELARLSQLRRLTALGVSPLRTVAPLRELHQLTSLALLACRLEQPAVDELAALPALQHLDLSHASMPPGALPPLLASFTHLTRLSLDVARAAAAAEGLTRMTGLLYLEIDLYRAPPEYLNGRAPRQPGGLTPQAAFLLRLVAAAVCRGLPALRQLGVTYPIAADPLLLAYCWRALDPVAHLPASRAVQLLRRPAVAVLEDFRSGAPLTD